MKQNILLFSFLVLLLLGCSSNLTKEITFSDTSYPTELNIIIRNVWGWKKLEKEKPKHQIKHVTLHHGGEEFSKDKNVIKYLQNLQSWSRSEKNWIDIPYHFMIDLDGNIYETRPIEFPGDTNTKYNPTGHALINVMGNYEVQKINEKQLKAVTILSAYLCKRYNVPVKEVKAHKDYAETLCPGKDFYRYLEDGSLRKRIEDILENKE